MKNFIVDVLALFKKKYEPQSYKTGHTKFIRLPPDIKPSARNDEPVVSPKVANPNNFASANIQSSRSHQHSQNKTRKQNHNNNDDSVDELATFILSSNKPTYKAAAATQKLGRWVTEHEALTINKRQIARGFYYAGTHLEALVGHITEPSLINEALLVRPPKIIHRISPIYSDESLGYWPSYERLSAACRGAYLDWLASDRAHLNTPIGYVFIYFGGFERRIIENINNDTVSDDEFISIYNELLRLHNVYGKQSSFNNYSVRFLEFMSLIRSPLFEDKKRAAQLLPPPPASSQNLKFKLRLAKTVALKSAIPATLAWDWLVFSDQYNFKTPAKRCEEAFKALFDIIYQQTYLSGFIVPPNKTKLKVSYHAASRSIVSIDLTLADLPDPSGLKAPIKKLIAIAEQCNYTLDAYSRYLGKEGHSEGDIAAIMLLPPALIQQQAHQEKYAVIQKFQTWAESVIQNDEGLTTTKELWAHSDEPLPQASTKSLTKKQNELIVNLAELAGFGIVPDQRYHETSLKLDGYVVLFEGGHRQDFQPNPSFYQVSLALRLGAMVATINGCVDKREVETLLTIIDRDTQLTTIEQASLTAYLLWRLNTPSNMAGLKAKLATLDDPHISFISRFIISVALANGNVEPGQIKQIEKLYQALGLDKTSAVSDIHHLTTAKKVTTTLSDAAQQKSANDNSHNNKSFSFDAELLASYESETGDAKAMLASIFAADNDDLGTDSELLPNEQVDNHTDINAANESVTKGLDSIHSRLYQQLISKEVWQRAEIEALCESLNLMINGAIETINDWAYDNVDAPVFEDDDEVVIDFEIVEELKTLG
ncbi:TerB N-terminal domain-containing protein [Psychrobacter sp. 72-O-c]|uniref:tellurite resistance TerB family protein n=1 Tax=Psychrobacter sp. 72-O-c TaxID=2774125 RepID=UPI00191A18E7|nr:TerB N-terminal domain-containing protein [Psychrobacter sp. 72-O-c]